MDIEFIVMLGVWGNLILQTSWFIWSYKNHHRKHYLDDEIKDDRELYEGTLW